MSACVYIYIGVTYTAQHIHIYELLHVPKYLQNKFLRGRRPEVLGEDIMLVLLVRGGHFMLQGISPHLDLFQSVLALVAGALLILCE